MSRIAQLLQQARDEEAFSGAAYAFGSSTSLTEQGTVGTLFGMDQQYKRIVYGIWLP